ncbi:MAG: polysaccharide deacetylase family protein [Erysipelotrichaceae bacterium]|nr:polysaccharide deacetylase family protein [Erysipelotrichaceae bacterium]
MKKRKGLWIIAAILLLAGVLAFSKGKIEFSTEDKQQLTFEYGQEIILPEVKAEYSRLLGLFGKKSLDVVQTGEIKNELGSYPLSWKASNNGAEKEIYMTVSIVDTTAPEITLVHQEDHFTDFGSEYQEEGYTAFDIHDGDLTEKVTVTSDGETVTYTVSDQSGNQATASRQIVYKDLSAPVITLNGSSSMSIKVGGKYEEKGCKAVDSHDGDLTDRVKIAGSVNTAKAGKYTITYTVSDEAGNTAKATRVVTVSKKSSSSSGSGSGSGSSSSSGSGSSSDYGTGSGGVVYLTFDDGPGPYTKKLLDILDKYNVKVTFFVTGNRADYRKYITEASRRGHTIALHSYSHSYSKCYTSLDGYWEDLNKLSDLVYQLTGKRSKLVRLPGGSSNTVSKKYCTGIITKICKSLTDKGYRYTDWNVSSGDAGGTTSASKVAQNVINGIKKHKVSIVLQHDIKSYSVDAVEEIIKWGLANGYKFLPMTSSSPVVHHSIRN